MEFNPSLPFHRRLLAVAVGDALEVTGLPLHIHKRPDGTVPPSLHALLAEHGVHMDRNSLHKVADIDRHPDDPYPRIAPRIAEALEHLGYWPPIARADLALRRLPAFFGAIDPAATRILRELQGEYVSYQYASRKPGTIVIGRATIGDILPLGGALAENYIAKTPASTNSEIYSGIAWADTLENIYLNFRALPATSPTFIVLDETVRPGPHTQIETLNGTSLGAARQYNRHLSAIAFHRGAYPENDQPIEPDEHDRLPEPVRNYLLLPLKNGPSNY